MTSILSLVLNRNRLLFLSVSAEYQQSWCWFRSTLQFWWLFALTSNLL